MLVLSASAFAQTPPPATAVPPQQAPLRMAFLDLQRIAAESSEGKVASGKVQELTKKKGAELQEKTKALQTNQQKLQQGAAVLNDAARAQTQKEIDRLTVEIDRFQEDANAEVQEMQQALQAEFQEKLRPDRGWNGQGARDRSAVQRRRRGRHLRRSLSRHHSRGHQAIRYGRGSEAGGRHRQARCACDGEACSACGRCEAAGAHGTTCDSSACDAEARDAGSGTREAVAFGEGKERRAQGSVRSPLSL